MNSLSRQARKSRPTSRPRGKGLILRDYIKRDCWTSPLTFFHRFFRRTAPARDLRNPDAPCANAVQCRNETWCGCAKGSAVTKREVCAERSDLSTGYPQVSVGIPPPTLLLYHTLSLLSSLFENKKPAFAGSVIRNRCRLIF